MKPLAETAPLTNLVREKLLRWSQPEVLRWVVACEQADDLELPPNVEVRPRVMRSRVASHRVPRQYRNASLIAKAWPDDHLSALRVSKLLCVTSGWATIELGEYELDLPAGTFLFIPAGIPQPDGALSHVRDPQDARECDVCWISPHGDHLHLWQCRSNGQKHSTLPWSNIFFQAYRLTQHFNVLQDEALRGEKSSPLITNHLLTLLLLEIQREVENEKFLRLSNRENAASRPTTLHDPIAMAVQYLDTNFESNITIASLAREIGMSRSQLARRFREQIGHTVVEYLTQKRLEQACKLLRETEYTVTHIAGFVGFGSSAYFHVLFRRRIGSSPARFRQQHLENKDDKE